MLRTDPVALAARQWKLDRKRMNGHAALFSHKIERMTASPLAFLRGSAPLFYELLREHEVLREGPPGMGWIAGDLHMENFGAFRPGVLLAESHEPKHTKLDEHVTFNLNDFDDALIAPLRWDVLRLTTSLILAGRELGSDGLTTIRLASGLLDSYCRTAFDRKPTPPAPPPVATLIHKVKSRSRLELLEARTEIKYGERRLVRGARYSELGDATAEKAKRAFAKYVLSLPKKLRRHETAFEVLDVAFRVAGTGSLGCLRVAVLVRGKGGPNGAWLFDMKEEGAPSASEIVKAPACTPARRVVTGLEACLDSPPQMIGETKLTGHSMFVRRLAPQEDKLDLTKIAASDMAPLAQYLGALTAKAHVHGAKSLPKRGWDKRDRETLLDKAISLAGLHEATYLAYCKLAK